MNFSEIFKQSSKLAAYSPSGDYVANVCQFRLIVRDIKTLQVVHLYNCMDAIQEIEWSPDSQFVLCVMKKRGIVQVWSLDYPEWKCKIDEGSAGLLTATWSPDSRHILTTAEFYLRITLWSLSDKSVSYMKYPKPCVKNIDFSKDGKYMALAERRNLKDHISIFDCNSWQLLKHFPSDTDDMDGIEWSPDVRVLAVWESSLSYRVCIYSVDGRHLGSFSAYDITRGLGIKSVAWSPTGQFLAVGSYDQHCRILNNITWRSLIDFAHADETLARTNFSAVSLVVYQEVVDSNEQSRYEVLPNPSSVRVPSVRPDPSKPNPRVGVSQIAFSFDNRYLATRNDNHPTVVWIWDIAHLSLSAVLLHVQPVRNFAWDPTRTRLALVAGSNRVYMWSPEGCLAVVVPGQASFPIQQLQWQTDGSSMLLLSDSEMCLCFLDDEEDKEN